MTAKGRGFVLEPGNRPGGGRGGGHSTANGPDTSGLTAVRWLISGCVNFTARSDQQVVHGNGVSAV